MGAAARMPIRGNVIDPYGDDVTATQLAVDGEVEQCQIAHLLLDLERGADCPNVFLPQRRSGSDQFPFVPGNPLGGGNRIFDFAHDCTSLLLTEGEHARIDGNIAFSVAIRGLADLVPTFQTDDPDP